MSYVYTRENVRPIVIKKIQGPGNFRLTKGPLGFWRSVLYPAHNVIEIVTKSLNMIYIEPINKRLCVSV